jgi:hypothetical protein
MMRTAATALLAGCGLWVLYTEGIHWIALWNLFPLGIAGLSLTRGRTSMPALVFAGITALAVALVHAAWVFDWGGTQMGSSTGGLIFLFVPILALLLGGCGWAAVEIARRRLGKGGSSSRL